MASGKYAKNAAFEPNAAKGAVGQFHVAWEKDADETGKDAATGRGEKVDVNLTVVKRSMGALRDQVSIRYFK